MRSYELSGQKLTDYGESHFGVSGGRLAEVDSAAVVALVALFNVVQAERGGLRYGPEVSSLLNHFLLLPVGRHVRVFAASVVTVTDNNNDFSHHRFELTASFIRSKVNLAD